MKTIFKFIDGSIVGFTTNGGFTIWSDFYSTWDEKDKKILIPIRNVLFMHDSGVMRDEDCEYDNVITSEEE